MRVLHVVPWYEPAWSAGGTATAVKTLCRSLAAQGVEVTVYTTNDGGGGTYLDVPLEQPLDLGGVEVWYFRCGLLGDWKAAAFSQGLNRKLRETIAHFDLIHVSSTRHWHGFQVYRLAQLYAKPYIITPHGSLMAWWMRDIGHRYWKIIYMRLFESRVINKAAAIHFLSKGERESSRAYIHGRPSFVVPNGIRQEEFECQPQAKAHMRKRHGVPDEATLLLFLGRIHPQKNIHLMIQALAQLQDVAQRTIFFIVGPVGDARYYQSILETIRSTGLNDRVRIFPPISRAEVPGWFAMADLLVLPSKVEGVSMSVIEAAASGVPVLISNRAANYREIEEDRSGVVVEPRIESILEALRSLLSDPQLLTQLSQNARSSARKRYSIERIATQMLTAYHDVLTGTRSEGLAWE